MRVEFTFEKSKPRAGRVPLPGAALSLKGQRRAELAHAFDNAAVVDDLTKGAIGHVVSGPTNASHLRICPGKRLRRTGDSQLLPSRQCAHRKCRKRERSEISRSGRITAYSEFRLGYCRIGDRIGATIFPDAGAFSGLISANSLSWLQPIAIEKPRAMRAGEDSQRVTSRLTIPERSAFILDSSKCSAMFAF